MNKKIKTLLVAGLLVVGMGGKAFAAEPFVSKIENPQIEEGVQKDISFQDGAILLNVNQGDGYYYYITTNWDSTKFKVISVTTYFEDGSYIINETQFKDGEDCATIIKEGDLYKVNLTNDLNQKIVKVEVKYDAVDSDGDGVPDFKDDEPVAPPVDPEEPPVDPEEPPVDPEEPPVDPEEPPVDPEEPPVEEPKEEITDPETGDSSVMLLAGTAVISAGGIYVLTRKKDEK